MTTPKAPREIPSTFALASTVVTIRTFDDDDAPADAGRRGFSMLAYTGGLFDVGFGPAVIDLEGLEAPADGVPIFRQHLPEKFIGRSTAIANDGAGLQIEGDLFHGVAEAEEVATISDQGGRWEASVGVAIDFGRVQLVDQDGHAQVNGRLIAGPFALLSKTLLRESSFVPIGAAAGTAAVALADDPTTTGELPAPIHQEGDTPKEAAMSDDKERIAELSAAFAETNPAFALKAITEGWSLMEAKAHRAGLLTVELAEQKAAHVAELAELAAKHDAAMVEAAKVEAPKASPAAVLSGFAPTANGYPADNGDPTSQWEQAVAAERALLSDLGHNGARRGGGLVFAGSEAGRRANLTASAVQRAALKFPELHSSYLAAFNAERGRGR